MISCKAKHIDLPLLLDGSLLTTDCNIQYYGNLSMGFPTGRPKDTEQIDLDYFATLVQKVQDNNHEFNFLLNGSLSKFEAAFFDEYFSWIIKKVEPSIITFSDYKVYHYLVEKHNYTNFEISAISGIKTIRDFNNFISKNKIEIEHISKLVFHHDLTRDSSELASFYYYLKENNITPRFLVTESCYFDCPFRRNHYDSFIQSYKGIAENFINYYQIFCVSKRLLNPESLIDISGFMLPEQIENFINKTGINSFKISGRSKNALWILNTAHAYLTGQSPENLFDIIVYTSPFLKEFGMEIQDLFYLDSKAYYELFYELIEQSTPKLRQSFLKKKAAELFLDGKLRINDPNSQYDIVNGELKLINKGAYLKRLESELDNYLISNNMQKLKATFDKSFEKIY